MRKFLEAQDNLFPPEVIQILAAVLDDAWATVLSSNVFLGVAIEVTDAREILAKAKIASAADGERDPSRLREDALGHLAKTISARTAG